MAKIRFIDGKEQYGIAYDWNAIRRRYKSLKVPAGYWDPCEVQWESVAYIIALSTRSTGKTTNALLFGMTIRAEYPGVQIGLVRTREEQIMPKMISQMLDTVRTFEGGRYIKQLTNGRWNDIQHDRQNRCFRYVNRDDSGEIYEKDEPFLLLFALTASDDYKSVLVAPKLDLLIFDEFISEVYDPESFGRLMNLIRTIFRDRLSARVCMMANTIRPMSPWYRELEISKELRKLRLGDKERYVTEMGTPMWLHVFDTPSEHRKKLSTFFFGFKNPALAAIRGDGELWVWRDFQHIVSDETDRELDKRLKIDAGDELLGVDYVVTEDRGLVANVHPVTKVRDGDIVLTNGEIWDRQHRKGRGYGPICDLLEKLEKQGKLYFSDAESNSSYVDFMAAADGYFD